MTASTSVSAAPGAWRSGAGNWPYILCWLAVALDGYDLVVLGAVIPTLTHSGDLGFTSESLTTAATLGLAGVGIGAVLTGPLADRFGRRNNLIASIAWFSVLTIALVFAPNVTVFIVLRFLAGLGLGACLPTALALISEHAGNARPSGAMTRMMTGYHVGAVITALLGLFVIDQFGWRAMFLIGGAAGLLVVPVMWVKLPESEAYQQRKRADAVRVRPSEVVRGRLLWVSLGLWVASFMGLLLVYGLNTWLPKIMESAGYSVQAGIGLLLTLNLGGVLGLLIAGRIADARGQKQTVLLWFGTAAVVLALLSIKLQASALVYAAVLLAGIFVFSAQVLVYAWVSQLYPTAVRGTALGMSAGIGRIGAIVGPSLGGALVSAGIAYPWGFYAFGTAAAIAVGALALVPSRVPHPVS
ncbi:aromatic acid/H+ symport family MFS transporter [Flexivirga sp. ID2601S]|uniref:Aromatic acid/H+ symport family MFS transporter n=1 Tax=Flexivirga aerilata TaxID=1656889 RepID=A0A849ANF0_9MICO|nr:aromatic acid/H+ symport family MFS transporter [Flexivirga aerilata]NNG38332.1 aromatic acid/H+ symport family MFS transporter [Flexivirga aerilata]